MAYCPTCKRQFQNETECPDCKTKLIKELPFQTMQADDGTTWVEIASTANSDEAQLMQGFLEAEGIDAQLEHAEANPFPTTFGKLGDVRIYVAADDEQRALDLLRQREREWEKLKDDDDTLVTDEGVAEVDENASTEPE
jgi:Putative prokaryotic signal transducing protein